jgi:cell division protein FtsZ
VTGGPDLSLVEVSEASSIVQEAADEDANIIFGAVVDPALKGKVKITVIATGFGPQAASSRAPASPAQTPVDLSHYNDHARMRAAAPSAVPAAAERLQPRLSISRRSLLDLPLTAAAPAPSTASAGSDELGELAAAHASGGGHGDRLGLDPDFDLSSTFDVPAFLRRQES